MKDDIVVVTGAAGVLGAAVAAKLDRDGYGVVAIDLAKDIPGNDTWALTIPNVDLTSASSAAQAFAQIASRFGTLSGLANIAGGFRWETIEDGSVATWEQMWAINVKTTLTASKLALPLLKPGTGAIVNVSAAATHRADAGMGAYAASKSAVSRLTEALAQECKEVGIRVNAVLPSIIDTPTNRADMPKADFTRWVSPDALADVIVFLLSTRAAAVTGALVPVTGRV